MKMHPVRKYRVQLNMLSSNAIYKCSNSNQYASQLNTTAGKENYVCTEIKYDGCFGSE